MTSHGTPDDGDVETAIDALYRAPLDSFTAERNALAASLRRDGRREAADRVKALAKPTATAWAVNQARWRDQAAFDEMVEAGARLRAAHVDRAGGKAADVRAAAESRQRAVDRIIALALDALGSAATAEARHRIAGTVEALASSGVPEGQTAGRLVRDLQATGLEMLGALAGLAGASGQPPPASRPARPVLVSSRRHDAVEKTARGSREADRQRQQAARRAEAEAALARADAALRAATREATEAVAKARKAEAQAAAAAERLAALEARVDEAREAERTARKAASEAARAASEADMMRRRTERDVSRARDALAAAGEGS